MPSISGGRRATSTNLAAGTHCPAAATTKVAEGVLRSWSCRCNGPGTRTMNAIHSACQIIAISYSEVPPDIFKFQVFFQFYYKRIIQDFDF